MARYPDTNLTAAMISAARETSAGKLIDRLLTEENARGGNTSCLDDKYPGSIIQQLWGAMMDAQHKGK